MPAPNEAHDEPNCVPISPANADRWLPILPEERRPKEKDLERLTGIYLEDSSHTVRAVGLHSSYEMVGPTGTCCNLMLSGGKDLPEHFVRTLGAQLVERIQTEKAPCLALGFTGEGELASPEILEQLGFTYFDTMEELRAAVPFVFTRERRPRRACDDRILTYDPEHHSEFEPALADHYNEVYGALRQPLPKRTAAKIRTFVEEHAMRLYFSIDVGGRITGQAEIFHTSGSKVVYGGSIIVNRRQRGSDLTHRLIRKTSDAAVSLEATDFYVHVSTWNRASSEVLKTFGFRKHKTLLSRYTRQIEKGSIELGKTS